MAAAARPDTPESVHSEAEPVAEPAPKPKPAKKVSGWGKLKAAVVANDEVAITAVDAGQGNGAAQPRPSLMDEM